MNDDDTFPKPFKRLKANECPKCGGTITIIATEINAITISANGVPLNYDNARFNMTGVCQSCGYTEPFTGIGNNLVPDCLYYSKLKNSILKNTEFKQENVFGKMKEGDVRCVMKS